VATKRTYGEGCAIAHGLDLVGERWALLVVRELLLGPKRFTDLKKGLPHASPNVLSERLQELERAGVVKRDKLPPPAASQVYALTDWGRELEPTVIALGHWGARSPSLPHEAPIGADSVVLAIKARLNPEALDGLEATYELRLGEDRFRLAVSADGIDAARGEAEHADATIEAEPEALYAVLFEGRSLAAALRAKEIRIEGDRAAVQRLVQRPELDSNQRPTP
jgi:DNA-binding HxlR family transcriptional regulator/putative sterol carrier protein